MMKISAFSLSKKIFFIALFFSSIQIAEGPQISAVYNSDFSILLIIGSLFFLMHIVYRKNILLPNNNTFFLFFLFIGYVFFSGLFCVYDLALTNVNHQIALQRFVIYILFLILMLFLMIYIYNVLSNDEQIYMKIYKVLYYSCLLTIMYSCIQLCSKLGITLAQTMVEMIGPHVGHGKETMVIYWMKVYGLTIEPSALSNWLIFFGIWFFIDWKYNLLRKRVLFNCQHLFMLIAIIITLIFSFSRTGYFGFFVECVLVVWCIRRSYKSLLKKWIYILLAVFAITWISFISNSLDDKLQFDVSLDTMISNTVESFLGDNDTLTNNESNKARLAGAAASMSIFFDYPITGVGFGCDRFFQANYYPKWAYETSEVVEGLYSVDGESGNVRELPTYVVPRLFSETGIVGVLIWFSIWSVMFYKLRKLYYQVCKYDQFFVKMVFLMMIVALMLSANLLYIFNYVYILLFPIYWDLDRRVCNKKRIV